MYVEQSVGMSPASLVSAVIATYNLAQYIPEAIQSALNQTYRPIEVIVVDDGSTDNTRGVVERYRGSVRYIRQPNAGVSSARNHGARVAQGKYVAFLDADDCWEPTKIEAQVALFERRPDLQLVHTDIITFDHSGELKRFRKRAVQPEDGDCYWKLFEFCLPVLSSAMVRREDFHLVGGFAEDLERTTDYDLWLRLAERGGLGLVPEPLARFRIRAGSHSHANPTEMMRETLKVLYRALSRRPGKDGEQDRIIQCRMASLHQETGWALYRDGKGREGRGHLLAAWRWRRTIPHPLLLWGASWLPISALNAARSFRRRLRG